MKAGKNGGIILAGEYKIVIRTKERKLELYRAGTLVKTYPVAVGKPWTPTPKGNFIVINKAVNPGGPFGSRWMGISSPHIGIHGTNNPASIGKAASNGCIRMQNKDVEEVFKLIGIGTPVKIV
jgi:lipoprotein-anchoring transpeptidase ErfK/SrfK